MAEYAVPIPEAPLASLSSAKGVEPLKSSGFPPITPPSRPTTGKLPQVRNRRGKQPANPARDLASNKVAPIWLGSGLKEEVINVKEIKQIVPEEMHHNENVLAIERFESDAGPYEAQKKYVMAAECLEQAINLRRKFLGDMHPDFLTAIERYVVSCNLWGIQCLNAGQHSSALELLMKAEGLTEADNVPNVKRRVSLRAATFNNLCCYFRARGKLNAALQFAEKALKIEQRYKEAENPARTHLNYAVLLSMMNRHEEAVEHIEQAIAILHDDERQISYRSSEHEDTDGKREEQHQEVVSTLVVAYYNHWVELGRLSRREAGTDCILRAANIAKRKLGASHALTIKMEETLGNVQDQLTRPPFIAHTLDTTDTLGDSDRQGFIPPSTTFIPPCSATGQLPALDTRAAWQNAKKDESLKLAVDSPQITLRYQPEPMRPQPPPGPKPSLSDSLKQLRSKEHIYGRTTHPILGSSSDDPISAVFDARPRIAKAAGSAGSPGLLQQAHGVQPMLSLRSAREGSRPPPVSPAHAALSLEKGRTASPAPKAALEPKPPTEAPSDKFIREAYAYYNKAVLKKKTMDGQEDAEIPLDPSRVKAIGVFKGRLEKRRHNGLPTPTESNRIRAVTMMQALWRGYLVRQWSVEELAKDVHRRRHLAVTALVQHSPDDGSSEVDVYTSHSHGPADMKRRVALRVVYAARRASVEYNAAVKIQQLWRGYVTRRDIRLEIARVATDTATKLQALFRRYSVVIRFIRYAFFATTMQTFWRRALARRRAKRRLDAVQLLSRVSVGYRDRKRLAVFQNAAVPVQCTVRGFLVRTHYRRCHKGALALQRVYHGWKCRRQLAEKGAAASRIAGAWRSYSFRKRLHQRHAAAYLIQQHYRLSRVNRRSHRELWAASKVGAAWRGYQLRKKKPYIESACKIQSHFRGVMVRKRLRRLPKAALRIQSAWRGYHIRNVYKQLVALVQVLQKITKRHLVNNKIDEVEAATIVCQKVVRGVRTRKTIRRVLARITRVQAIWRSAASRQRIAKRERAAQQIQAFVRKSHARRRYLGYKHAAVCVKAAWDARRIRLAFKDLRDVSGTVARWMRGHLVRRKMKRLHSCAAVIQRGWRGYHTRLVLKRRLVAAAKIKSALLARHRQICFNTFRLRAVIGMQRLWRAHVARRRFKAQQRIARILQNHVRGYHHRKRVSTEHQAAIRIQAAWRRVMWKARVDKRDQSAIKLQSAYLGMLDRKRIKQRNKVAVLTQCIVRCYTARAEKEARLTAARKIARWLRARTDRSRFLRTRKAVAIIQDHFRSRQTRRRFLKLKRFVQILEADSRQSKAATLFKKQLAAVATIQKCWRRTAVNMKLHTRVVSAIVIQKYIRGWLAVLNARRTQEEKLHLVLRLQSQWRRKMEQRRYAKKRDVQRYLDSLMRCYLTRRMIRTKMHEPATKIVTAARLHLAKKRLTKERNAATKIQKVSRGFMARKELRFMHEEGPAALQSRARVRKAHAVVETKRYYTHRQLEANLHFFRHWKEYRKEEAAALQIQTFYRMHYQQSLFQRKIKWALPRIQGLNRMYNDRIEFRAKKEAAICIQKCVRAYCITNLPPQHAAARKIQMAWRKFLVKPNKSRQQFSEFATQSFACLHIQTVFRRYVHTWRFLRILVATVRIQAMVRMHLRKKSWRRKVDAARRIQVSMVLIWLAKRRAGEKRKAALKMQSFARRVLARLRVRREHAAAVKMQAAWRSALCRDLLMQRRHRAATKLQASVRMHFQRDKAYPRRQAALRTTQAHARGFLVRNRIARQNAAAAKIQIRYRINRSQHRLKTTRWLVLALQKLWRGKVSRRKTSKMMRLVRIPALARGRLWRRKWIGVIAAATVIQRIWRGRRGRNSLSDLHDNATKMQSVWRCYSARKKLKNKRAAKKMILRMIMRWRASKGAHMMREIYTLAARSHEVTGPVEHHRAQIDATITIQRVVRGTFGRERVEMMQAAACILQKYARGWLCRRKVRRRRQALGKLQALVDGAYRRRAYAVALAKIRKVQAYCRMHAVRRRFLEKRSAQIHIARCFRRYAWRKRLVTREKAAKAIAKNVRIWLGVKRYRGQRKAAITIQSGWRGKLDRDEIKTRSVAAETIESSWRRWSWVRKHRRRRHAGVILVGGAIMWKQLKLRRRRVEAAKKIQAGWRGCCARANVRQMQDTATKIQKWWKDLQTYHTTSSLAVEILVQTKLIREAYVAKHALVVQKCFRKWRDNQSAVSFTRTKRGVILLQSHFRRRRAARHVEFHRQFMGIRLRHLVHNDVIVFPDTRGKLSLSRDVRSDEHVEELQPPEFVAKRVNVSGLSAKQRDRLAYAVAPIQSLAKWQSKCSRIIEIQRVWRGHLARKILERRRRNATKIQAAWCAKIARAQFEEARTAATKIEARMRGVSARNKRRQEQETQKASNLQDEGDEVVDGIRIRRGGSVLD